MPATLPGMTTKIDFVRVATPEPEQNRAGFDRRCGFVVSYRRSALQFPQFEAEKEIPMKFLIISTVVIFFAVLTPSFINGQDSGAHTSMKNPITPTPANQARAKEIYSRDCIMCHGKNGDGKTDLAKDMQLNMKDWTDPSTLGGKTDGQIFDIIRHGVDKMPPESKGRADDEVLWNLVTYIRSLSAAK